jgi:uncharacterized protein (UPF0335 family)
MATAAQKNAEQDLAKGLSDISASHQEAGTRIDDDNNVTSLFKPEDPGFMQRLRDGAEKIARIQGERKELSASIAEVMATFENEGLNRHAVKSAIKFTNMNETEQENYDLTYTIMRKALGKPVQGDLFEARVASELRDRAKKPE